MREPTHKIEIEVEADCSNADLETAVLRWLNRSSSIIGIHRIETTRIPPADEASRREVHRLASQLRRSNARIKNQETKDGSKQD